MNFAPGTARVVAPSVVRLGGMPAAVLGELRFEMTCQALDQLLAVEAQLSRAAAVLSDDLYAAIGELAERDAAKAALVGLRRSIHNGRRPGGREWNSTVRSTLTAGVAQRVVEWLALRRAREDALRSYREAFTAEIGAKRSVLREACRHPWFRRGLAISSPDLSRELDKWLSSRSRAPRPATIARVVKYLCRSAAKTSLFSSFGIAGFAGPTSDRPGALATGAVTDLDGRLVEQVLDWIVTHPELRDRLSVRVNPSACRSGDAIDFVRYHRVTGLETVSSMRSTPTVGACLRLVDRLEQPTLAQLRYALRQGSGSDDETAARYLDRLVEIGLLEVLPPPLDPAREPTAALTDWLQTAADPELAAPFAQLTRLIGTAVPVADLPGQRSRLTELAGAIAGLRSRLALEAPPMPEVAGQTVRPAHYPFHETVVAVQPVPPPGPVIDDAAAADLEFARRLLHIFDSSVVTGTAMADFFLDRYGAGERVPLIRLYRDASRLRGAAGSPATEALADIGLAANAFTAQQWIDVIGGPQRWLRPGIRRLQDHWRQVSDLLRRSLSAAGEVELDRSQVERVVDGWPARARGGEPSTFYLQVCDGDAGAPLVLNEVSSGYGKNRSRIHHLLRRAGASPAPLSPPAGPADVVFAELSGLLGGSTNQRTATAPYEIQLPHLVSGRPAGELLPLSDLVVVYDEARAAVQLRSVTLGERVVPLHSGMMAPFLLPGLAAMMTQVFGASQHLRTSVFAGLTALRPESGSRYEVRRLPRVTLGAVVLFRAAWVVTAADIPRPRPGEPEPDFVHRFWQWSTSRGVPERSFTRLSTTDASYLSKDRKPLFLDLGNFVSLMDFARRLRADGDVIFEEALPDPVAAGRRHSDARVSELVVELATTGEPA